MVSLAIAQFDFESEEPGELQFKEGAVITVINQDESGWWLGELKGSRGLFPYNYVEIARHEIFEDAAEVID